MSRRAFVLTTPLACLAAAASAHHSLPANYVAEEGASRTLQGTLTEVEWRSPHVRFSLLVSGAADAPDTWRLESYPASYFEYRGFGQSDFAPGTVLTFEIYPARAEDARQGWARTVRWVDGRALIPVNGD